MILESIIKFFNEYYGVDVSNVNIVFEDMENNIGYYDKAINNTIFISGKYKDINMKTELIMVHELNHLMQYEYNKGLTINSYSIVDIFPELESLCNQGLFNVSDIDMLDESFYWDKHVEIDSRLAEALYIYEQVGIDGLELIIDHVFKCGSTENMYNRLINMPNSMAKFFLLNAYEDISKYDELLG